MLRVNNLSAHLGDFRMNGVNLSIADGEYFVLLGPSGAGKSVLIETLAGMVTPSGGTVSLDEREITHESIQARGIGLIFQKPELFPHLTVKKNIGYGLQGRGQSPAQRNERINQVALATGVMDLLDREPASLSGGEAQRVALARALAPQPRCLLLDEPLASLDTHARIEMRKLLRRLNRDGMTMLHVTHDFEEAFSLAHTIGIIDQGRIIQVGRTESVLHQPSSDFVARFIGFRNVWSGTLTRPMAEDSDLHVFQSGRIDLVVHLPEEDRIPDQETPGFLFLRSEDVIVSCERLDTSARNTFPGRIADMAPTTKGVEVTVDVGVEVTALITESSVQKLDLKLDKDIWVSFKATAGRFCASGSPLTVPPEEPDNDCI